MPISLPASVDFPEHELTLRVDHTGTAFGGTPTWADWSSKLLTAGDGEPITITRLRTDENAEVTPSTCSFVLDNPDGSVTPGNAAAPAGWDVGAEVNVRMLVLGTTYDRFDGYVDSIEPAYPGSNWSMVRVSCTDITARPALTSPLRSMVEQEMLEDSPLFLHPLAEPSDSTSAGSLANSATVQPLVTRNSKYGVGTLTFGSETTLIDGQQSVAFDSTNAGSSTKGAMSILAAQTAPGSATMLPTTGGFTFECWFNSSLTPSFTSVVAGQFSNDANAVVAFYLNSSGKVYFFIGDRPGNYASSLTSTNVVCDGKWHHLKGMVAGDYKTVTMQLDGVDYGTDPASSVVNLTALTTMVVGGQVLVNGNSANGLRGSVALVAGYAGVLSSARGLAHYQAATGTLVESSGARFARIAGYGNLTTTGLPAGLATMAGQNTAGKSITEELAKVARTEGSVSYATGAGALTFQARTARYDAITGLALTSADISPDTTTRRDRQGMANEFTVTCNGGAVQRFVDTVRQNKDGRFDGGQFEVACSTDDDALQNAAWQVGTRKSPRTRLPSLTVDLLTMNDVTVLQQVLAADISTLATVTALPSQAPSASMSGFVEGWTETIGAHVWTWSAFTSPNLPSVGKVTAANDPYSATDGTMLVGF